MPAVCTALYERKELPAMMAGRPLNSHRALYTWEPLLPASLVHWGSPNACRQRAYKSDKPALACPPRSSVEPARHGFPTSMASKAALPCAASSQLPTVDLLPRYEAQVLSHQAPDLARIGVGPVDALALEADHQTRGVHVALWVQHGAHVAGRATPECKGARLQ